MEAEEAIKLAKKTGVITPEIEEAKSTTTAHIENIFRGTDYALPGKIYAKAKIYLDGIVEAVKLVPDDGNDKDR